MPLMLHSQNKNDMQEREVIFGLCHVGSSVVLEQVYRQNGPACDCQEEDGFVWLESSTLDQRSVNAGVICR
jgi:hypothetical protein